MIEINIRIKQEDLFHFLKGLVFTPSINGQKNEGKTLLSLFLIILLRILKRYLT